MIVCLPVATLHARASEQCGTSLVADPKRTSADVVAGERIARLLPQYQSALQRAIVARWIRPASVAAKSRCPIEVRQLPGGEVIDVQVLPSCEFDTAGRQSIEAAIRKASPLPYYGYECVFARTLRLNFQASAR